jgi:putative tryptophan/tyrosine transport system substrate-binding protein
MKRREFITLVGTIAAAWPAATRAQQAGIIGVLGADATAWSLWTATFARRLRERGWVEGNTITIEYRWSEGRTERVAEIAVAARRVRPSEGAIADKGRVGEDQRT